MKIKKVYVILAVICIILFLLTSKVNANVQSRPNTGNFSRSANEMFQRIRKMETVDGPMGLSAIVEDSGVETSSPNNIDVHMIKNTEWGAAVMLSSSSYGTCPDGNYISKEKDTTTGNKTGIYDMASGNVEQVAGIGSTRSDINQTIYDAPQKYWDKYEGEFSKVGDATLETKGWKKGKADFIKVTDRFNIFVRREGMFGYGNTTYGVNTYNNGGSRAAVVNGSGL